MQVLVGGGKLNFRILVLLFVAVAGILMLGSVFYAHGGSLDPRVYHDALSNTFAELSDTAAKKFEDWTEPDALVASSGDMAMQPISEPAPHRDFSEFQDHEPLNMVQFRTDGFAFATLYCSHTTDPGDPYLAAVQQVIWRLLWSNFASKHPVVVFVCPFIRNELRYLFRAQGAWVEELDLFSIKLNHQLGWARWQDQFAKLNLWNHTQFKRIAYLDSDAFPIANPDRIFDLVQKQHCRTDLLSEEDMETYATVGDQFCDYLFAGVKDRDPFSPLDYVATNGGLLVLEPNPYIHAKLLRNAHRVEEYDSTYMEQSYLSSQFAFNPTSAFPPQELSPVFNFGGSNFERLGPSSNKTHDSSMETIVPSLDEVVPSNTVVVLHDKIWLATAIQNDAEKPWWIDMWARDWMAMCRDYDSFLWPKSRQLGRKATLPELLAWIEEYQKAHPES